MSNIERKYAYYDEGVLPDEGEYGITYLTLYSSGSGNVYDGWIYDPEDKIPVSGIERTFGFRNPEYPQYCWDDEVVVDLSNPQTREESEFEQGRLTSFNTNVSSRPIILEDTDITGLTESEREAKATTVLFTAIPLVKDAYIQAMVEVQMKVNISPDNTDGNVRVEAFYILNDESDRTMRPNPVHTFAVTKPNERHTLPWLYWNPALKHEVSNYIGVKLLCTGGTAEIGISDDPDYGDAMITLVSAGLVGDKIYSSKPDYIELSGKEEVPPGYHLSYNDYTVIAHYLDTGEAYNVTRLCSFEPEMGSEVTEAVTYLTAYYQDLTDMMVVLLGQVLYIELTGNETIHGEYTFDISDYKVIAYFDNGDEWDVTSQCVFNPAMGTTVTEDTRLTATYAPFWMHGNSFQDSLDLMAVGEAESTANWGFDIVYTRYTDDYVVISGNVSPNYTVDTSWYDNIESNYLNQRYYRKNSFGPDKFCNMGTASVVPPSGLPGSGVCSQFWNEEMYLFNPLDAMYTVEGDSYSGTYSIQFYNSSIKYLKNSLSTCYSNNRPCRIKGGMYGDEEYVDVGAQYGKFFYYIDLGYYGTAKKIEYRVNGKPLGIVDTRGFSGADEKKDVQLIGFNRVDTSEIISLAYAFCQFSNKTDLSWLNNKKFPKLLDITGTFAYGNHDTIESFDSSNVKCISCAFIHSTYESIPKWIGDMDVSNVRIADFAFGRSTDLKNILALSGWNLKELVSGMSMFCSTGIEDISSLYKWNLSKAKDLGGMFYLCKSLTNLGRCLLNWNPRSITNSYGLATLTSASGSTQQVGYGIWGILGMFSGCEELEIIQGISYFLNKLVEGNIFLDWMFYDTGIKNLNYLTSGIPINVVSMWGTFAWCTKLTDISKMGSWYSASSLSRIAYIVCRSAHTIMPEFTAGSYFYITPASNAEGAFSSNDSDLYNDVYNSLAGHIIPYSLSKNATYKHVYYGGSTIF